jgi:hypothetical protein
MIVKKYRMQIPKKSVFGCDVWALVEKLEAGHVSAQIFTRTRGGIYADCAGPCQGGGTSPCCV